MSICTTFIRGNRCIEREKYYFKSREVKRLKECALALSHFIHFCSYSALSRFTDVNRYTWIVVSFFSIQNPVRLETGLVQTKFRRGSKMWHVDKCIWFSIIALFSHKYISFYLIGGVLRVISVHLILYSSKVKFVNILKRHSAIFYNEKCIWSVATRMTLDASNTSDTC